MEQQAAIDFKTVSTEDYELSLPENQKAFLILFPCFPCDAAYTKRELGIEELARNKGIAVLNMNFNQRLWLTTEEKKKLQGIIEGVVKEHQIKIENTVMGGFSSGGNVSLLLTNYLVESESIIQPKALFIVDSPIDLWGLYENAVRNVAKNYSEVAVSEASWIVETFQAGFGLGDSSFREIESLSPYTYKTHSISNLTALKELKMRFYSEPDTIWWWENRQTRYEELNSFYLDQFARDYNQVFGDSTIVHIQTQNRGYRSNGDYSSTFIKSARFISASRSSAYILVVELLSGVSLRY